MTAHRPHRYLTDVERRRLDLLICSAARRTPDGRELVVLWRRALADDQHRRGLVREQQKANSRLRARLEPPPDDDPEPVHCATART